MHQIEQHTMELLKSYKSGVEEWYCPICERQFVMRVHPSNGRLDIFVLEPGDQTAFHAGSKGGLRITGSIPQSTEKDDEPILSEDLRDALDALFKDLDFGD